MFSIEPFQARPLDVPTLAPNWVVELSTRMATPVALFTVYSGSVFASTRYRSVRPTRARLARRRAQPEPRGRAYACGIIRRLAQRVQRIRAVVNQVEARPVPRQAGGRVER